MKKKATNNSYNPVGLAVLGASLAGLAGSAYFFLGSHGKKNQKHFKSWAIKMKGDVVEKLEKAREISEPIYREIIDSVAIEYEKTKKADNKEIQEVAQDLKKHWKTVSLEAEALKHDVVKNTRKIVKKAK